MLINSKDVDDDDPVSGTEMDDFQDSNSGDQRKNLEQMMSQFTHLLQGFAFQLLASTYVE